MTLPVADLRVEYFMPPLQTNSVDRNPFVLFQQWLAAAVEAGIPEPNAMALATADAEGRPSARMVLLKGVDAHGLCFFTNYESRKGQDLAVNPWAALVFWWGELARQVRVEGQIERLSGAESDAYYHSRPLGSRLGAWASNQSRVIGDRTELEQRLAALQEQYTETAPPPRPSYWGGYRLVPETFEFWQGGAHRLHDRLRYTRRHASTPETSGAQAETGRGYGAAGETASDLWQIERLAP